MRSIVAFIAYIVVCLGVATANPVVVVNAPVQGAVFDGMSPVTKIVRGGNLTAAKVIGSYSAVPTAPKTFVNRPVILGVDPHPHVVVAHPHGLTVIKAPAVEPISPPHVFTSPYTNTASNVPAPIPAPYSPLPAPFGLTRPPTRSERRVGKQIGKLVQMIVISDTKGEFSNVLALGTTLRRVVTRIGSNHVLTAVAGNALAVVNPIIARAARYLPHDAHRVKKIIQGLNTKEDRLIAKYKAAARKIAEEKKKKKQETAKSKAKKTLDALKAKIQKVKEETKPASAPVKAAAPVKATAPVKAAAATNTTIPVAPVKPAKPAAAVSPAKPAAAVSPAKPVDSAKTAEYNDKLQKYVLALGKEIHSLKKTIKGNEANLRQLSARNVKMEEIIVNLNKKVAAANTKYNVLAKRGNALSTATKRAIGTISSRMKANGQTIKKVVSSKKAFKKNIMSALATLEENIHKLQASSNKH